ncbi:RNA-directed DNA polymerase, eukaryota, reverse transcriptase zinc-binding domain protein, partial [Tanacetum coccineum]
GDIEDAKIKYAMFQIDGNKAPGPDGFSSHFFKKAWTIVGKDVCEAVKEFFSTRKILKEINSTLISLIPKIQNHDKVTDFRPIACFNVIYKCISKLITNRMKGILDKLVVNWKFLEAILKGFGFHDKMIYWIMSCVTTVTYSICVNDENCGYFKGGRGLRQGDPMYPYLFTLVMEILSLIVQDKVGRNEKFHYHFGCKQMKLTHVCFADDLLMFCHGDMDSVSICGNLIVGFIDRFAHLGYNNIE